MRASPEQYRNAFELTTDGHAVLEDIEEFCGSLYVPGGQEAERQTLVNLGRRQVLDHILRRIAQASA